MAVTTGPQIEFDNPQIYPTERKMELLVKHEDNLIKNDINAKDNRLSIQRYVRLKGHLFSQSYFIFDCE